MTDKKPAVPATAEKQTRSQVETKATAAAQLDAVSASAKKESRPDHVLYVSANKENAAFSIRAGGVKVRSIRNKDTGGLVFRVPTAIVKQFEAHEFVTSGRVVKAKE